MYMETCMDPMPKMKSSPSFCFIRSCKPKTMGIGRQNKMTSETMLQTAVAMYRAVELMHVPVVMLTSKLF